MNIGRNGWGREHDFYQAAWARGFPSHHGWAVYVVTGMGEVIIKACRFDRNLDLTKRSHRRARYAGYRQRRRWRLGREARCNGG
jgi:hypothetical protein